MVRKYYIEVSMSNIVRMIAGFIVLLAIGYVVDVSNAATIFINGVVVSLTVIPDGNSLYSLISITL